MTPTARRTLPSGLVTHEFAETPVMSTYLVAAIVGDFDSVSARHAGLTTTVYTPPGASDQGRFALGFATNTMTYLESLFGVPYIGDK